MFNLMSIDKIDKCTKHTFKITYILSSVGKNICDTFNMTMKYMKYDQTIQVFKYTLTLFENNVLFTVFRILRPINSLFMRDMCYELLTVM